MSETHFTEDVDLDSVDKKQLIGQGHGLTLYQLTNGKDKFIGKGSFELWILPGSSMVIAEMKQKGSLLVFHRFYVTRGFEITQQLETCVYTCKDFHNESVPTDMETFESRNFLEPLLNPCIKPFAQKFRLKFGAEEWANKFAEILNFCSTNLNEIFNIDVEAQQQTWYMNCTIYRCYFLTNSRLFDKSCSQVERSWADVEKLGEAMEKEGIDQSKLSYFKDGNFTMLRKFLSKISLPFTFWMRPKALTYHNSKSTEDKRQVLEEWLRELLENPFAKQLAVFHSFLLDEQFNPKFKFSLPGQNADKFSDVKKFDAIAKQRYHHLHLQGMENPFLFTLEEIQNYKCDCVLRGCFTISSNSNEERPNHPDYYKELLLKEVHKGVPLHRLTGPFDTLRNRHKNALKKHPAIEIEEVSVRQVLVLAMTEEKFMQEFCIYHVKFHAKSGDVIEGQNFFIDPTGKAYETWQDFLEHNDFIPKSYLCYAAIDEANNYCLDDDGQRILEFSYALNKTHHRLMAADRIFFKVSCVETALSLIATPFLVASAMFTLPIAVPAEIMAGGGFLLFQAPKITMAYYLGRNVQKCRKFYRHWVSGREMKLLLAQTGLSILSTILSFACPRITNQIKSAARTGTARFLSSSTRRLNNVCLVAQNVTTAGNICVTAYRLKSEGLLTRKNLQKMLEKARPYKYHNPYVNEDNVTWFLDYNETCKFYLCRGRGGVGNSGRCDQAGLPNAFKIHDHYLKSKVSWIGFIPYDKKLPMDANIQQYYADCTNGTFTQQSHEFKSTFKPEPHAMEVLQSLGRFAIHSVLGDIPGAVGTLVGQFVTAAAGPEAGAWVNLCFMSGGVVLTPDLPSTTSRLFSCLGQAGTLVLSPIIGPELANLFNISCGIGGCISALENGLKLADAFDSLAAPIAQATGSEFAVACVFVTAGTVGLSSANTKTNVIGLELAWKGCDYLAQCVGVPHGLTSIVIQLKCGDARGFFETATENDVIPGKSIAGNIDLGVGRVSHYAAIVAKDKNGQVRIDQINIAPTDTGKDLVMARSRGRATSCTLQEFKNYLPKGQHYWVSEKISPHSPKQLLTRANNLRHWVNSAQESGKSPYDVRARRIDKMNCQNYTNLLLFDQNRCSQWERIDTSFDNLRFNYFRNSIPPSINIEMPDLLAPMTQQLIDQLIKEFMNLGISDNI